MQTSEKTAEQKGFETLEKITQSNSFEKSPFFERIFGRWLGSPTVHKDWVVDAEWARIQQEPVNARRLLYLMVIALVALIIWAGFAELDEVTRGDGRVIPSRQLQVIQSIDGGIIEELLVTEGQVVNQGDVLLRIDPTRAVSSLRESRAQFLTLSAEVSRLDALLNNLDEPVFSDELMSESPDIVANELASFNSNKKELEEQISIFNSQLQQRQQDLIEAQAARTQYSSILSLSTRELNVTRPLLASGAVSDIDIIRLERDISTARGELNRAEAAIARSRAAITEAETKTREVEINVRNRWRAQHSESRGRLNMLIQAETGLSDVVKQTSIRSPIRGTVQRILTHTQGGVITAGRDILEIIPLDDQLLIEARIAPKDIAFIRPGQNAIIKFSAYDFSIFGGLDAHVEHISADTITDERDNTFYLVRLKTLETNLTDNLTIIPGMTTQVDIVTGRKTLLEYLMKPILRATSEGLRER